MGKDKTADVKNYYDGYVRRQLKAGINERHHTIRDLAIQYGLKDGMNVLEIGCGIGTLTGLILQELPKGRLTATDLSPVSVEKARHRLGSHSNLILTAGDSTEKIPEGTFDMIILPDVLEHIPFDRHSFLFKQIKSALSPSGHVLIHSPDPFFCEWLHANRPELMQVIDLPLHLPALAKVIDNADLCILNFQRHSIWQDQPDYMAVIATHKPSGTYTKLPQPKRTLADRVQSKLKTFYPKWH